MNFSAKISSCLLLFLLAGVAGVKAETTTTVSVKSPIQIFVSIAPHLDFCKQIGGNRVNVQLLLTPGQSPGTYAPAPQKIEALSRAQLFFRVGLPFERALLAKIKDLPRHPLIIDTQTGITRQKMPHKPYDKMGADGHDQHQHRPADLDPHTWLDPRLAIKQATTIAETLCRIDPDGKEIYLFNLNTLKEKLKALHQNLSSTLEPLAGSNLFVYHPAFGYFARAYNLHQLAVEVEGKRPKAKALTRFIKKARKERAQVIFVQPQFDQQSAEKIAATLNCTVIAIDPLAQDYCANLSHIAELIRENIQTSRHKDSRFKSR